MGTVDDTSSDFEYHFDMLIIESSKLTKVYFNGFLKVLVELGGLYKSLSLIATITFSYFTTKGFEKKMVRDMRKMDPDLFDSQTEEQVLAKLKQTITVDN